MKEYIQKRETGTVTKGFINIGQFFERNFGGKYPRDSKMIGAPRKALRDFTKVCTIIADLGKMGVIRDVDEILDQFEDRFKLYFNY